MTSSLELRSDLLVHWRSITSPLGPTWRDIYHNAMDLTATASVSICSRGEPLLWSHGVFEAPNLQQSDLEALSTQRRVVEGQAALGSAVVQLRVDVQSVTFTSSFINDTINPITENQLVSLSILLKRNQSKLDLQHSKQTSFHMYLSLLNDLM